MSYEPKDVSNSQAGVYIFITLFFLLNITLVHKYKHTQAVYSRSYFLTQICALFCYIESILVVIYGYFLLSRPQMFSITMIILSLSTLLVNEFFFVTLLLKVYRIFTLIKLQTGHFKSTNSVDLRSKLSIKWNIKIILLFGFLGLTPKLILYSIEETVHFSDFKKADLYQTFSQISLECLTLVILIIYIAKSRCDISLRVEYALYAVAWASSFIMIHDDKLLIYLIYYPLRNMVIMMINVAAIYEHDKHFVLPLPDEIDLDFALKSEFFVKKLKEWLRTKGSKKHQIEFELLFRLCVYDQTKSVIEKENVQEMLDLYKRDGHGLKMEDFDFDEVFAEVYAEFDTEFFQDFYKSKDFIEIKIEYLLNE